MTSPDFSQANHPAQPASAARLVRLLSFSLVLGAVVLAGCATSADA